MFVNIGNLAVPALKQTARGLGIDGAAFDQCLDSGTHAARIREDVQLANTLGVNSTPTFYVNGRALIGAQPFDAIKQVIDEELARVK